MRPVRSANPPVQRKPRMDESAGGGFLEAVADGVAEAAGRGEDGDDAIRPDGIGVAQ